MAPSAKQLLTRSQLPALFEEHGLPISWSLLTKLCAAGVGPPVDYWWGQRPRYTPATALKWARARLRPGERPPQRKRA